MKAKHVFLSVGLSLVMGAAVAASGVLSLTKEMKPANAGNPVNLYFDVSSASWWNNDGAETYAHCFGGTGTSTTWPGAQMSLVAGSSTRYVVEVDDACTQVIFTRVDPSNHTTVWNRTSKDDGQAINLPADYTISNQWNLTADGSSYDDGNYCGHWSLYTPPAVTYQVDVYVDGVKRGTETIGEGELPEEPALTVYGTGFSGWYSDSTCSESPVTEITSDTTVYGKTYELPQWSYEIDTNQVSTTFANKYVYAFESNGRKNAAWPGIEMDSNTIIIPNDAKFIINNGATAQTEDITQSCVANDILRILNDQDGSGNYLTAWRSTLDEPYNEGYYICGVFSGNSYWTYDDAEEMTITSGENVAYEMNFLLAVGDELRVRSFYTDRFPYDQWAELGDNGYDDPTTGWGEKSGDNFKATKAGYYDIYAKYEDHNSDGIKEAFMFYVAEHVDTYEIQMTAVLFEGKEKIRTANQDSQLAYSGSNFEPNLAYWDGYSARGAYTDENCTVAYTPTTFNAAGHLYVKYTKLAYYVTGDAAYAGSASLAWSVDCGSMLSEDCADPNNMLEGSVTIPNSADADHPVAVKPLEYIGGNDIATCWAAVSYTIPNIADYDFVTLEGGNLCFTKGGTYAIYVNHSSEVYLSEGLEAFYTKFLSEVGGVCSEILGGTKDLDNLKNVWLSQKAAYESLSAAEKATISGITGEIDGGDPEGDRLHQVVAKYSYIVHKYGTANCEDFVWGGTYAASSQSVMNTMRNNTMLIIAVSATVVLLSAGLTVLLIKRRKEAR